LLAAAYQRDRTWRG